MRELAVYILKLIQFIKKKNYLETKFHNIYQQQF